MERATIELSSNVWAYPSNYDTELCSAVRLICAPRHCLWWWWYFDWNNSSQLTKQNMFDAGDLHNCRSFCFVFELEPNFCDTKFPDGCDVFFKVGNSCEIQKRKDWKCFSIWNYMHLTYIDNMHSIRMQRCVWLLCLQDSDKGVDNAAKAREWTSDDRTNYNDLQNWKSTNCND